VFLYRPVTSQENMVWEKTSRPGKSYAIFKPGKIDVFRTEVMENLNHLTFEGSKNPNSVYH